MKVLSSLIAGAITLPAVAALAQQATARPATFRTLATFDIGPSADPHVSPDGRFVLLSTGRELQVYDVATKRMRKLVEGRALDFLEWSRAGDRIAWTQAGDDGRTNYVWTMPMDPRTATPTGPAQRVTAGESAQPAISLDGRWLAYAAPDSVRPGSTLALRDRQLAVVPVTGGPERVLAHIEGGWEYARWSSDGKSIYVSGTVVGGTKAAITKVYLDGRKPEVVRRGTDEWFPGMTADRRHLVLVPARNPIAAGDRAIIIDTTGKEVGRVPLPDGTVNHYDDVLGDSALVWLVTTEKRSIEIGSMNGGRPRRIPVVGESNHIPTWSPDGKRIAFQVRENGRYMLALMNADGTNVRTFRDTDVREGYRWSPDSKYILFSSRDWHRLFLLDVTANSLRPVLTDTTARVGNWTWSTGGRSIVAAMLRQPMSQSSLDEITLTGGRRKLVDMASLPGLRAFQFVGDSAVYYTSDSAAFLNPLYGGPTRKLGDVPPNTQFRPVAVSPDRQWLAGPFMDAQRPGMYQLEVTSLASGERRLIDVRHLPSDNPGTALLVRALDSVRRLDSTVASALDALALEQLFLNLLINAGEALGEGGRARVEIERVNGHATVKIIDTGGGIPHAQLAWLGQPFKSTKPYGTGLGVPIARRIAQAHGGELRVESVQDVGTTAIVHLPLAVRQPAAIPDIQRTR